MVSSKPSSSKKAKVSDSASKKVKGENFYHNAKTAGRLKMMKGGKPVYDRKGKMIQAAAFQKGEDETIPGRVQPDRRWFGMSWVFWVYSVDNATDSPAGNTRVISQTALDHFRTSLSAKQHDPYSVLLRRNKLPMALLDDASNSNLRKVCDRVITVQAMKTDTVTISEHTSLRRNRSKIRLVRKLSVSALGWTLEISKS